MLEIVKNGGIRVQNRTAGKNFRFIIALPRAGEIFRLEALESIRKR